MSNYDFMSVSSVALAQLFRPYIDETLGAPCPLTELTLTTAGWRFTLHATGLGTPALAQLIAADLPIVRGDLSLIGFGIQLEREEPPRIEFTVIIEGETFIYLREKLSRMLKGE